MRLLGFESQCLLEQCQCSPRLSKVRWLLEGRLEQVLREWIGHEAPPISLMYRREARSSAAVRAFGDFASSVFAGLTQQRLAFGPPDTSAMPDWFRPR